MHELKTNPSFESNGTTLFARLLTHNEQFQVVLAEIESKTCCLFKVGLKNASIFVSILISL